jgi:hypothetical protein
MLIDYSDAYTYHLPPIPRLYNAFLYPVNGAKYRGNT